jgi:Tol biopolymer transport system component
MSRDWRVAYYDEQTNQLCAMYGDGRNKLCLDYSAYDFPIGTNRVPGSWSPDGSKFLIDANFSGIYIWELGGSVTAFRDSLEGLVFWEPVWSSDGNFIAYRIGPIQSYTSREIGFFIDSLDRTVHRRITPEGVSADWSPDGRSIAYSTGDILVLSLDEAEAINLTQHPAVDVTPKWSPDGRFIAFLSDRDGSNDLYLMNSDGSGVHKVKRLPIDADRPYAPFNYTWLPDGKQILYHDKLIDLETGDITSLHFPFDAVSATWFMKSENESILPMPMPQ